MRQQLLALVSAGLILFAILQVWRRRDIFHPVCMQSILLALLIGVRVPYILWVHADYMPPGVDILSSLYHAVIFYSGFLVLAAFTYKCAGYMSFPCTEAYCTLRWTTLQTPAAASIYVTAGVAGIWILAAKFSLSSFLANLVEDRSVFAGNWALFYMLIVPLWAAVVCYVCILSGDRRPWIKALMVSAFGVTILGALLSGFRSMIIQALIPVMLLRSRASRKIGIMAGFTIVLAVVAIFPVMDGILYGKLWPDLIRADWGSVVSYYEDNTLRLMQYAYGRYYTLEGTARTLESLDSGAVNFDHGRLILAFPKILLPTVIVGSKPSASVEIGRIFFADRYGTSSDVACVTSLPAFMYWQAGWLGYIIGAVFYGLFVRYWVTIYEKVTMASQIFIACTYSYFYLVFSGHVAGWAELIYIQLMLLPVLRIHVSQPGNVTTSNLQYDLAREAYKSILSPERSP